MSGILGMKSGKLAILEEMLNLLFYENPSEADLNPVKGTRT